MSQFRQKLSGALAVVLLSAGTLSACLWDYDTLAQEALRFPGALELITGNFVRHSKQYYEWRVKDREARLEGSPNDERLVDDLAVALDKLARHEEAIALMRGLLEDNPERYETHANLGTFLIHSGDLEAGLKHIEEAIRINPDAHFGREIYQAHLVRYVLERRAAAEEASKEAAEETGKYAPLPLRTKPSGRASFVAVGFAAYLTKAAGEADPPQKVDSKAAVKGVLGMMRFGQYDSPVLLEALGDLLQMSVNDDAKRMAARAYLKASYETEGDTSEKYRKYAKSVLHMQVGRRGSTTQIKLAEIEGLFKQELRKGRAFADEMQANEMLWIRDGVDVDAAFTATYYNPKTGRPLNPTAADAFKAFRNRAAVVASIIALAVLVVVCGLFAVKLFNSPPANDPFKPAKP